MLFESLVDIFSEPLHFNILEFFHATSLHFSKHDEFSGPDLICSNPHMLKVNGTLFFPCCTRGLLGSEWPWVGTVAVTVAVAAPSAIYGCWGSSWLGKQSPPLAQPFAGGKCALLSLLGQLPTLGTGLMVFTCTALHGVFCELLALLALQPSRSP